MVSGKCNSTWRLNVIQQQNPFNYIPFPQQCWITKNKFKKLFFFSLKRVFYRCFKMAVRDKNCKYSKTEDKGLSFLCFIQYFGVISVLFWRKTALLRSPTTAAWDETAPAAGITSSWRFHLFI